MGPLIGMICQFGLMPAFAYLLGWLFLTTNYERLGLVLLGCSPGGAKSNFWVIWKLSCQGLYHDLVSDCHVPWRCESVLHDDFFVHNCKLCIYLSVGVPAWHPACWSHHPYPLPSDSHLSSLCHRPTSTRCSFQGSSSILPTSNGTTLITLFSVQKAEAGCCDQDPLQPPFLPVLFASPAYRGYPGQSPLFLPLHMETSGEIKFGITHHNYYYFHY